MPDTPNKAAVKPDTLFLHDPGESDVRLDFLEYWRTITKRKAAIASFALVITLLTAVVVFVMTPIYRATATILIEPAKQKVVSVEEVYGGFGSSREHYQTQVELIKSHEVALRTIIKLRLYDKPEFDPRAPKRGIAALLESIGFSTSRDPAEWNEETLAKAVLPTFTKHLSIEPIRLSELVTISYESPNAELASQVANAVANSYIETDLDARYEMTHQASVWLQGRLKSLKDKLTESEDALQTYREKKGIADVKGATQSGAGEAVQQLTMQLVTARARRAEAENAFKAIKGAQASGELSSLPAVLRSPMVAEAKKQESEAERKMSEVAQRYGKQHPKFVQAAGELATAHDNVNRQVDMVVAGITQEFEAARGTERALEGTLANARSAIVGLNRQEFGLNVLERDAESNRQMYDMFIKRGKETNVASDLQSTVARIVDPAAVPARPIKPNKPVVIAVALVLGSLIGMMIALMLDLLDNTLKRTEDVEMRLKQPILTVLPKLSKDELDRTVSGTQVLTVPNSIYSEAIRSARTGVLLSSVDLPKRILLVTSSVPGEGKTTFSANLALAHAHTKKTLLIDADMRRPSIGKAFGLEPSAAGLSDLVSGTAKFSECLHTLKDTNLAFLPSGPIPPNPLELLHSEKFKHTLEMLTSIFDIIIIDSPPVELVSDALVIASQVTGVIFVTKAMSTPYPLARKAIRRIRRANGSILGVVLNALDFKKAEKYYGEYSVYGKYDSYRKSGYAGGYGETYGALPPASVPAAKKTAVIDLHCHLLPGVDDGPETMDEAMDAARAAVADGIRTLVLTPHIIPGLYDNKRRGLQAVFDDFARRLKTEGIPLEVRLGGEVRICPELFDLLSDDDLPFLGTVDGYRILLLEFPHEMIPIGSDKLVTMLLRQRIRPLIAHPERNEAVMDAPDRIRPFVELGCWLQLTAASLAGRFGELEEETAWQLIDAGWNCVVATDSHNVTSRPPHLSLGRDALASRRGTAFALDHVRNKPANILGVPRLALVA